MTFSLRWWARTKIWLKRPRGCLISQMWAGLLVSPSPSHNFLLVLPTQMQIHFRIKIERCRMEKCQWMRKRAKWKETNPIRTTRGFVWSRLESAPTSKCAKRSFWWSRVCPPREPSVAAKEIIALRNPSNNNFLEHKATIKSKADLKLTMTVGLRHTS